MNHSGTIDSIFIDEKIAIHLYSKQKFFSWISSNISAIFIELCFISFCSPHQKMAKLFVQHLI